MRVESAVTTISWIPSEAVTGPLNKPIFDSGVTHYDQPPPDDIGALPPLGTWLKEDRFRFANRLGAAIDVVDGEITGTEYTGGLFLNSTRLRLGRREFTFQPFSLPTRQDEPEIGDGWARFTQTVGGQPGLPAPRRVNHPPFFQLRGPVVWTTLSLTLHVDGTTEHRLVGASRFPRHWVYGPDGALEKKAGLTEFKDWYRHAFGKHTPWGDEDSPTLVTEVESAMERELATSIMRGGAKPETRKVKQGDLLTEQGQPGHEIYLLLDGVLRAEVDGELVAELGPGAIVGERAVLEGGTRTATLRAVTSCRVAVADGGVIDLDALAEISEGHKREQG
jgi:Cyclic nucleotide-binding domain